MTIALAIPESPLGWLLAFFFVLVVSLGWYLGAIVVSKLVA
jgi:hypothetical protein